MRFGRIAAIIALTATLVSQAKAQTPRELVPDQATAVAIARAVLIPIYGKSQIAAEEPLKARRDGKNWNVSGTLGCTPNCLGGTAFVSNSAVDGRILSVFHTK